MRILSTLHRFAESGEGDVKALQRREELRLRIGDYRLFFVATQDAIEVCGVAHGACSYGTFGISFQPRWATTHGSRRDTL